VRFVKNTYTLTGSAKYFHYMNNLRTVAEWKGYGQDVGGVFK
jgi:hypothetical protein